MDKIVQTKEIRRCIIKNMSRLNPKQQKSIAKLYNKPLDGELKFYMSTLESNPNSGMARNWLTKHKEWLTPSQKRKLTHCCQVTNLSNLLKKL